MQKRAKSANEIKVFFQIVVNLIKNGKNFETCILDKLTKYFIGRNINIVSQFMEMEEEQQARDLEIRQVIESSYYSIHYQHIVMYLMTFPLTLTIYNNTTFSCIDCLIA